MFNSILQKVSLPSGFPQNMPVLIIQSVYHRMGILPYKETRTSYPYSPRWSGKEMVERIQYVSSHNVFNLILSKFDC